MLYPNKFIALDEKRIFVYNTLFNLPEIYLLAAIIDYFAKHPEYKEVKEGFKWKDLLMSYTSIFQVGIFKKIVISSDIQTMKKTVSLNLTDA